MDKRDRQLDVPSFLFGGLIGMAVWSLITALVFLPRVKTSNHRQGVIDHATGEWQAERHEPTDSWNVWEVADGTDNRPDR